MKSKLKLQILYDYQLNIYITVDSAFKYKIIACISQFAIFTKLISLKTKELNRVSIFVHEFFIINVELPDAQGGLKPGLQPCVLSWSNFATSCSRPMKLLHYVSQAPHTNICNSIMHKLTCKMQRFHWHTLHATFRERSARRRRRIRNMYQRFHWTRATRGDVWPRKSTHGCKPGFRPPCGWP